MASFYNDLGGLGGGGAGSEPRGYYAARALSKMGISAAKDMAFTFDDFDSGGNGAAANQLPLGWASGSSGGTALVAGSLTNLSGGVHGQNSGSTAGQFAHAFATPTPMIATYNSTKFYMAWRARLVNGIGALTAMNFGFKAIGAGADYLSVGFTGAVNGANFCLHYGAGSSIGGAQLRQLSAADLNWHVFEMWATGDGNITAAVDEVEFAAAAAPAFTSGGGGYFMLYTGENVNKVRLADFMCYASERTA